MLDLTNIEKILPNTYYSVSQTIALTGVGRTTFYKYVRERKLRASFHKTNHMYFKGSDILKFLKNFF